MWFYLAQQAAPTVQAHGSTVVQLMAYAIVSIAGSGGIVAYFKARSDIRRTRAETEKLHSDLTKLPVQLAQGAVVVHAQVLKDVRIELDHNRSELDRQAGEIKALKERCQTLEVALAEVTHERDTLRLQAS